MTVQELMALLADYPGDTEVRVATQPNWPLAWHVADVQPEPEGDSEANAEQPIAWIVAAEQVSDQPYAPAEVFGGRF